MIAGEISTKDLQNPHLEVFHVKLTDSCLKALEKAASKPDDDSCKLELSMKDGNTGSLTISQDNDKRTFGIVSSDIMIDPKGSFDCVKRSRVTNFCQSLASLKKKLTIQATDDTYSATREKIQLAELDAKKNQTKQIKGSGSRKGARRLVRNEAAASSRKSGPTPDARGKPVPPIMRQSAALDKAEALQASKAQSGSNAASHAKHESGSGKLAEHSLRERVVHLLALKAYTEPEILLRLKKDGLSPTEKTRLPIILSAVGHPNRAGKFLLLPKLFEEVQLTWPDYSAQDRDIIAKRRASTLRLTSDNQAAKSKDGFHQSSARRQTRPMPLAGSGGSVQTEQKLRAIADVGDHRQDEERLRQVALKYCVSRDTLVGWVFNEEMLRRRRAKELGVPLDSLPNPNSAANSQTAVSGPAAVNTQTAANSQAAVSGQTTTNIQATVSGQAAVKRPASIAEPESSPPKRPCARLPSPVSDVSPNSCCRASPDTAATPNPTTSHVTEAETNDSALDTEFEKFPEDFFQPEYPDISSREQMVAYKSDFHREYKEYKELYVFVSQSIEKLKKLETELDRYPEHSAEYERVGAKIVAAVDSLHRYGKNPREVRRRFDFLDAKLSHIKKQIAKYRTRTSARQ